MTNLLRVLALGVVLSAGLTGVAFAGAVKVGDTVHVCGCGGACHCGAAKTEPGKCGCGKDTIPAKVTKVEGDKITVDRGGKPGETTFKSP